MFGFLGPNGAGKTTTIRLLMDFIKPQTGSASILNMDCQKKSVILKRSIGYLSGNLSLYDNLTGQQFLNYMSHLYGSTDWQFVQTLTKRFSANLTKKLKDLSKGNKQKIGIIQAFMHRPEVLILDEPTDGLDPLMQQQFYKLILDYKKGGKTFLISSHNLSEVERICDSVAFVRESRLIESTKVSNLKHAGLQQIEVIFDRDIAKKDFFSVPNIKFIRIEGPIAIFTITGSLTSLLKKLTQYNVKSLRTIELSLEDIFMHYYKT